MSRYPGPTSGKFTSRIASRGARTTTRNVCPCGFAKMNSRTLVGMSCAKSARGSATSSKDVNAATMAARTPGRIGLQPRRITPFAPWTHEYTARTWALERRSGPSRGGGDRMNRGITLLAAPLLLSSGALAAQAPSRPTATKAAAKQAPKFDVDPMWPKPLANRWILGSSVGVAVDSRDHVFMVHLTDSFTPRTEIGLATDPPTGECCAPAPNVLEYDAAGTLVNHWGGPGTGYAWPAQNTGLAVDDSGNVWIGGAGGQDSRILKFSHDGKFIAEF